MTPDSVSNAATPPIGNPYPQCASAIAYAFLTIPGRHARLVTCSKTPASIPSNSFLVA